MERVIALIVMVFCSLLILSIEHGRKMFPYRAMKAVSKPNKFSSEGDTMTLGPFSGVGFSMVFECKINSLSAPLVRFQDTQLSIEGSTLTYGSSTRQLPTSLYEANRWFEMVISTTPELTILLDQHLYKFSERLPANFDLVLGGAAFSGAFAEMVIDGLPAYRPVTPGVNQHGKPIVSVGGFNSLGLYGTPDKYSSAVGTGSTSSNYRSPILHLSNDLTFSIELSLLVLKDGIYFIVQDSAGDKVTIGRNIVSSDGAAVVDLKSVPIGTCDKLVFEAQSSAPQKLTIQNISNGSETMVELPKSLKGGYSVSFGDTTVCLVTSLSRHGRSIWHAGEKFSEMERYETNLRVDLTGAFVVTSKAPRSKTWSMDIQFTRRDNTPICLCLIENKVQSLKFELQDKAVVIRHGLQPGSEMVYRLEVPHDLSTRLNTLSVGYDRYLRMSLSQSGSDVIKDMIRFSPSLESLFSAYDLKVGSILRHKPQEPDPAGRIYLQRMLICGMPFGAIPSKTVVKDTSNVLGCIVGVDTGYHRDATLFQIIGNKTIGLFLRHGHLFLSYNKAEFLVAKELRPYEGLYRFQLRLDKECQLVITNPNNDTAVYSFKPGMLPTRLVTVTLSDKPCYRATVLGRICAM